MQSSESMLPDKPGNNRRSLRVLLFIGAAVILALILIGIMARTQEQTYGVVVGTVYPITPRPRFMANGEAAGDPKAKVQIDVYEDFQCPACREYTMALEPQLMRNDIATGKVYYVFHSFLIIDRATWASPVKESHQAANAAMCAADQNRFWDYHDMLFNNWTEKT